MSCVNYVIEKNVTKHKLRQTGLEELTPKQRKVESQSCYAISGVDFSGNNDL